MKQKTNISVKNNLGYHINANVEIADNGSYESGLLMDANAIEKLINTKIAALVNGAGANSDTLKEISDAIPTKVSLLNNDSGFITNDAISSFITEQALYDYLVEHQLLQPAEEPAEEPGE